MSCGDLLSVHLNDYLVLIDGLLESLESSYAGSGATQTIMDKIIRKEELMQECLDQLVHHQHLHQQLHSLQTQIQQVDNEIIDFACQLGHLEHQLQHQAAAAAASASSPSISSPSSSSRSSSGLSVDSICVLSEKVGLMSFAPADFIERKGLVLSRPPAPLEAQMGNSLLQLSLEQLLQLAKDHREQVEEAKQKEQGGTGTGTGEENWMAEEKEGGEGIKDESIHFRIPASGAASTPPSLPSFSELAAAESEAAGTGASSASPSLDEALAASRATLAALKRTPTSTPSSIQEQGQAQPPHPAPVASAPPPTLPVGATAPALELDLHMESESDSDEDSD